MYCNGIYVRRFRIIKSSIDAQRYLFSEIKNYDAQYWIQYPFSKYQSIMNKHLTVSLLY